MGARALGYFDYVKAAFNWKYTLGPLGKIRLNIVTLWGFAILGLGYPGFWLLGCALEGAYLLLLSGNDRFQMIVNGKDLLQVRKKWSQKKEQLIGSLGSVHKNRYYQLENQCRSLGKGEPGSFDDLRVHGIGQLLWTFLQLLLSQQRIMSTLSNVSSDELEKEVTELKNRIAEQNPESPLFRSLSGSLDIAVKRRDNILKASETLKVIEAELDRIEKHAALLVEESLVSSDPDIFTNRLDSVMQSLQDTSKWLTENSDVLDSNSLPPDIAFTPSSPKVHE